MNYEKEPGFAYDLITLFIIRFNDESWFDQYKAHSQSLEDDAKYYKQLREQCAQIPDSLLPFFKQDNSECLVTRYYFLKNTTQISRFPSVGSIEAELRDTERLAVALLDYYLPESGLDRGADDFLRRLSQALSRNVRDMSLRYHILSFFINPSFTAELLATNFHKFADIVREVHIKNKDRLPALDRIYGSADTGETVLDRFGSSFNAECKRYYTLCFIAKWSVLVLPCLHAPLLVLGSESFGIFGAGGAYNVDIYEFGRIVSDKIRLRILAILHENRELYTTEIKDALGMNMTTAYYHLNMMQNEGVIKTRYVGRRVYYSINNDYIRAFQQYMNRYMVLEKT